LAIAAQITCCREPSLEQGACVPGAKERLRGGRHGGRKRRLARRRWIQGEMDVQIEEPGQEPAPAGIELQLIFCWPWGTRLRANPGKALALQAQGHVAPRRGTSAVP